MRFATPIALLACLVPSADAYGAMLFSIENCDRLQEAAQTLVEGNVAGLFTVNEIECDEWTDIYITENKLKLYGDNDGVHTLKNVRFVVSADAVLRSDVPLELTGDGLEQEVNGGLLNVAEGGKARFLESVYMYDVGVTTSSTEDLKHGGCIYNSGYLRFEGEFHAQQCMNVAEDDARPGNGSGLWNGPEGKVIFKSNVAMEECGTLADGAYRSNYGGAIYSEGNVSFYEDAVFESNASDSGGAINNAGTMKFLKRSKVTFSENESFKSGGHLFNSGTLVMRNTAEFLDGVAGGSGGAINVWHEGRMTFIKHVDFIGNTAGAHGGAISTDSSLVDDLPADATYTDNVILHADYDFECDNVYVNGPLEDGYTCLP